MVANIASNLLTLSVDIDDLSPLPGNPRKGNVEAIKASYKKFGQLKPIVAVRDDSGELIVIAGNHQLQAAKELGWSEIATSVVDLNHEEAIAFALADNRVSELGSYGSDADLHSMISEAIEYDEDFFEALGWDDFSVAAIENSAIESTLHDPVDPNAGWTAPELVIRDTLPVQPTQESVERHIAQDGTSTEDIVTRGSTAVNSSGTSNAVIQYTLVFSDAQQQGRWYSFLRYLKESPVYDGETTAERLLDFIAQHSPRG
jgi:hypothetical protein